MEILKHQQEDDDAVDLDSSSIANLRSLLERRGLEKSVTTTQEERARLQLHSNKELEDARAGSSV